MNRFLVFLFGVFLVFGLVGAWVVLGEGGEEDECIPSCSCSCSVSCPDIGSCPDCTDSCEAGILESSSSRTIYYYFNTQESHIFGKKSYYKNTREKYHDKYCTWDTYTDSCSKTCSGTCGSTCSASDSCCGRESFRCGDHPTTCDPWQSCSNQIVGSDSGSGSCGSGGRGSNYKGCMCVDNYCKGWCMDNAPAYDGLSSCSPASDGDWAATSAFSSKPAKYKLDTDYHPADMGGGCYCNYYKIKNYYECDSSQINDSHPCSSNNCAPDFANGRAYCCPEDKCAHLGDDVTLLNNKNRHRDTSINPNLYCYDNGAEIQYEGHKLTCNNGVWETTGNGETIYQFPLFHDEHKVYPEGYTYRKYSVAYPLNFDRNRKVEVSITNSSGKPDSNVLIKIFSGGTVVGSGTGDRVVSAILKKGEIRFYPTGESNGKDFNIYVDVYVPKEYKCIKEDPDDGAYIYPYECEPETYCVEDYDAVSSAPSYCCPEGFCAYDSVCYDEGIHSLTTEEGTCKRKCEDSKWKGGLGEGETCNDNCDCVYAGTGYDLPEYNLKCKEALKTDKKVCCPEKTCAVEPGLCCIPGDYSNFDFAKKYNLQPCKDYSPGKDCSCVERDGDLEWDCINTTIKKEFSRVLLTKKSNTYLISSIFSRENLGDMGNLKSAELIVFFDRGTYSGDVSIGSYKTVPIKNSISVNLGATKVSDLPTEVKIEAPINDPSKYFYYTGAALILEVE